MEVVMNAGSAVFDAFLAASRLAATFAVRTGSRRFPSGAAFLAAVVFAAAIPAQAEQAQLPPERGVVVSGEGSASVPPDYAQVRSGVTTRAKTAKEATDANTKAMAAITAMTITILKMAPMMPAMKPTTM